MSTYLLAINLASPLIVTAGAQNAAALRVGVEAKTRSQISEDHAVPERHVARGALIGAGIGAATGLLTAVSLSQRSGVTDHSEDDLVLILFTATGALFGLIAGGIAGYFWK